MTEMEKHFEEWLHRMPYRLNTIHGYLRATAQFFMWCQKENIPPQYADYNDVLAYINYCREIGNVKHTLNQKVNALRHFFNWCMSCDYRKDNAVAELRIRGVMRKMPHDLLNKEELERIYKEYPATAISGKRNKVMLGLLIYQGITTAELTNLEVKDVRLEEGKLYVPSVSRSNSRVLTLEGHLIIQLQNYLMQIRPVLLAVTKKQTTRLFMSSGKSAGLTNGFGRMLVQMRKMNPAIKNLKQIRASVITLWLKKHNIRQVQYMTGHRYVSSTERYRTDKLESLQEQLEILHPLQ